MLPHRCQNVASITIIVALIAFFILLILPVPVSKTMSHLLPAIVLMCLVVMLFSREKVEDEMIQSLRVKAISKSAIIYFCFIVALKIIMLFASKEVRNIISDINADAGIVILFALHYYNSFKRSIQQYVHEK